MSIYSEVWEILVPATMKSTDVLLEHHHQWDERVRAIAGGLTIQRSVQGHWVSSDGRLFKEKMIPVRIICSKDQIREIIDITLEHYDQEAVVCYKLSSNVIIRYRT